MRCGGFAYKSIRVVERYRFGRPFVQLIRRIRRQTIVLRRKLFSQKLVIAPQEISRLNDATVVGRSRFAFNSRKVAFTSAPRYTGISDLCKRFHFLDELFTPLVLENGEVQLLTPRPAEQEPLAGLWVSLLNPASNNWMHWISECLVALDTATAEFPELEGMLVDQNLPMQHQETLSRLFPGLRIEVVEVGSARRIETLALPHIETFELSWNRNIYWSHGQFLFDHAALKSLRDRMSDVGRSEGMANKWIYIRRTSNFRRLKGAQELESKLQSCGFCIVQPENLDLVDQVDLFSTTSLLVAQAGAALANMMFMPKGSTVIFFYAFNGYSDPNYWIEYGRAFGLNVIPVACETIELVDYEVEALFSASHPMNCDIQLPRDWVGEFCQILSPDKASTPGSTKLKASSEKIKALKTVDVRDAPIFIGGFGRSGTSLMGDLLSNAPTTFMPWHETKIHCEHLGLYGIYRALEEAYDSFWHHHAVADFVALANALRGPKARRDRYNAGPQGLVPNRLSRTAARLISRVGGGTPKAPFPHAYGHLAPERFDYAVDSFVNEISATDSDAPVLATEGVLDPFYVLKVRSEADFIRTSRRFLDRLVWPQDGSHSGKRWLDDTPMNIPRALFLIKMFPEAQFINMVRDPRDVVMSTVTQSWSPSSVSEVSSRIVKTFEAIRLLEDLLAPEQLITVRYEDLVVDYASTMRDLGRFLNITVSGLLPLEQHIEAVQGRKFASAWSKVPSADVHEGLPDIAERYGYDF